MALAQSPALLRSLIMKYLILSALIMVSCSEKKNSLQDMGTPTHDPDLSIRGLELKPYAELKSRSDIIENVKRIGYGWENKDRPVNMQQWKYYCGEPDAISINDGEGDDVIMLYFYEREDIQKTWVNYIIFKNNLLTRFGINDASVNDHSKFTILNAANMPKK